jgi:hypothetical protein
LVEDFFDWGSKNFEFTTRRYLYYGHVCQSYLQEVHTVQFLWELLFLTVVLVVAVDCAVVVAAARRLCALVPYSIVEMEHVFVVVDSAALIRFLALYKCVPASM